MNKENKTRENKILIIFPGKGHTRLHEAWNKEIKDLSTMLPCRVLTCGDIKGIYKKKDNYIVLNHNFILSPLFAIFTYVMARKYDIVLLEYGPSTFYFNIFIRLIEKRKLVYRIKTYSWIDHSKKTSDRIYRNIKDFKYVIVSTRKGYEEINRYISSDKIFKLTPGIDTEKYPYCSPEYKKFDVLEPFKILFASAPLRVSKYPEIFEIKGINMLLKAIKYINDNLIYNVKLCILWRGAYLMELEEKITEMGLKSYIEVINRDVNILDYYRKCHATIFPATDLESSPDFPSTIMESLCARRPVIVSNIFEISDIIKETKSGVVCGTKEEDLVHAIEELIKNYMYYTENCDNMDQSYFSLKRYIVELKTILIDRSVSI